MSSNWSKSSHSTASGFLHSIPGYTGYKDKERRRDESRVEKATLGRGDNIDPQERAQRRAYRAG